MGVTGQRIKSPDRINLVTEKLEADSFFIGRRGINLNDVAAHTMFMLADSWYLGANIPGKPRVFMPYTGGVGPYRQKCNEVRDAGYVGFTLAADEAAVAS